MTGTQRAARMLTFCAFALGVPAGAGAQMEISARAATITVGGRLHTQFVTASEDTARSQFFHRRARIQVDVRVADFLDGRVEPDFAGGRASLQDAWARLTFAPELRVSVGQFKRAFTYLDLASANDLPIVERDGFVPGARCAGVGGACSLSRLTQQLQLDGRDLGLRVEGALGERVAYVATLTNGQGTNASDANDAKSTSGRLELTAAEGVKVGVFGALHDHLDPISVVDDSDFAEAFGADVEVGTWRNTLHLIGTVVSGNNWRVGPDADFLAAQLVASYYAATGRRMLAGVEPLLRVSWADPHRDEEDVSGWLLTPGAMVYFQGRNGLSVNLDWYSPDGDEDSVWALRTQLYLYF